MTFYHCYREVAPDTWMEIRNPSRSDGRWHATNAKEATEFARTHELAMMNIKLPRHINYMAIPQHRVHVFPNSVQDERPWV